jgi:arsenite oxidase small subunit
MARHAGCRTENGALIAEVHLQRRQLILGLASLPTLAAFPRSAAAEASKLAVAEQTTLAEPWAAVEFTFELEGERVPGIVIKLPGERWYASSLICPHANCVTRYFRDVTVARDTFDVAAKNPVLGCPCHFSVFDVADGGKVIGGPAPGAPLRLIVEVQDGKVFVSR